MKKFLFILMALLFVACGNSPESVAKKFYESAFSGDVSGVVECIAPKQQRNRGDVKGKAQILVESATHEAKRRGGFSGVKISVVDKNDDFAKAEAQVKFKNGSIRNETVRLYKNEGEWLIKM